MNDRFIFSCVIISAKNTYDLNEWFNIKNPYGVEMFDVMITRIYLGLLACSTTPLFSIILEVKTEDKESSTKIMLHREQLELMTHEEIRDYLKNECLKYFELF